MQSVVPKPGAWETHSTWKKGAGEVSSHHLCLSKTAAHFISSSFIPCFFVFQISGSERHARRQVSAHLVIRFPKTEERARKKEEEEENAYLARETLGDIDKKPKLLKAIY